MSNWTEHRLSACLLAGVLLLGLGCRQDMHDQPSYSPLEPSEFFASGSSAQLPVEGTVARGQLRDDAHLYTGRDGEDWAANFPFEITREALDRGQQRYDIFCSVCHDRLGTGSGMIAQRGFRRPPTLHSDRLREAPVGYMFDVITNGFGAMPDYRSQIRVEDRWRIVAYTRALQLSQHATPADLPAGHRGLLDEPSGD